MTNIAIYSRKSIFTDKGDSIENQINLCKMYCTSRMNSKDINFLIYEDEGFSGKDTHRPEFQNMLKDIKDNKINTLICYRLDRISRNVAHFSETLELLQKYNVNFISIKEQFDTTTPMGRAMIYIASVFAQLERETIAERVRDNMLQLSKSGRWLGGTIPFGFNIKKKNYLTEDLKEKTLTILTPNNEELKIIKTIYDLYLNHHSIRDVARILNTNSYKGKKGGSFDPSMIRRILRNPLYVMSDTHVQKYLNKKGINVYGTPNGNGYLTYNKSNQTTLYNDLKDWIVTVSNHKGIINSSDWLIVQNILDSNKEKKSRSGTGKQNHALFSGILKCAKCGSNMVVVFSGHNANNNNLPYEYYSCSHKINKLVNKCSTKNIPVPELDNKIISELKFQSDKILFKTLNEYSSSINKDLINDEIINLNHKISEKESESKTLIFNLSKSKSDSVSNRIMDELNTLDNTISKLNEKLLKLKKDHTIYKSSNLNISYLLNSLNNFNETINIIDDISQKRFLIKSIVDYAVWDSDTDTVSVHLICNKNTPFSD